MVDFNHSVEGSALWAFLSKGTLLKNQSLVIPSGLGLCVPVSRIKKGGEQDG